MAKSSNVRRILVSLQRLSAGSIPLIEQAHFTQSILDGLGSNGHIMELYAQLKDDRLILSRDSLPDGYGPIRMKRPSFCPIQNLKQDQIKQIPDDIKSRGIDVGAVIVVETCDGKVLLTRRAQHLKAFPGVWVPPGGHLEIGETMLEAGLRELKEETGLEIGTEHCCEDSIPILCLWESVYPAMLSAGLPRRHHTVMYLHAKLKPPFSSEFLQSKLKPDPGEVGACAWIDREMVQAIVAASDEDTSVAVDTSNLPSTFRATLVDDDGKLTSADLPVSILTRVATGEVKDIERVSTGTKFGLSEWLKRTSSQ